MVETRKELRQLAIAQRRTETSLRACIESRRVSNGGAMRKVDLR
jgi:hypothetical protein